MKNFIALFFAMLLMVSVPTGCSDSRSNTNMQNIPGATIDPKAAADHKAYVQFTTDANGQELSSPQDVQNKIDSNSNSIVLLQMANKYLKQRKQDLQDAIDAAWLYGFCALFGIIGLAIGIYGAVAAPLGTKTIFIKIGLVLGALAIVVGTLAAYIAYLKYVWMTCGLALIVIGIVYGHKILSALHTEAKNGNLEGDAAEKLPFVGAIVKKANDEWDKSQLEQQVKNLTEKAEETAKTVEQHAVLIAEKEVKKVI